MSNKINVLHFDKFYIALSLLIILNIAVRIPVVPHELGIDSFFIHELAASIVTYNQAKWIIHPLSFFGLYPLSYASAVPFTLAEISLLTGMNMERTILFFSIFLGVLGTFASYLMAGVIKNDRHFRLLVALIYSLSPLFLKYTVWTASARGLFFALLPLFIWSLLKYHKTSKKENFISVLILFLILAGTHKMFVFLFPVLMTYLFSKYIYDLKNKIRFPEKFSIITSPQSLVILFLILFLIQFKIYQPWLFRYHFFEGNEWYIRILSFGIITGARFGPLLVFAGVGIGLLLWKRNKDFNDLFLLITIMFFLPFVAFTMTVYQFLLPFLSLLAGLGALELINSFKSRRIIFPAILSIILIIPLFSGYTLYYRFTNIGSEGFHNYLDSGTYSSGMFLKNNMEKTDVGEGIESRRLRAISGTQLGLTGPGLLIYDYADKTELEIKRKPFPRSLHNLFGFIKNPFNVDYPTPEYDVGFVVQNDGIVDNEPQKKTKVYDNSLISIATYN